MEVSSVSNSLKIKDSSQLQTTIDSLPPEVFYKVLSHLDDTSFVSMSRVNRSFRNITIGYLRDTIYSTIFFTDFLRKKLANLSSNKDIENSEIYADEINRLINLGTYKDEINRLIYLKTGSLNIVVNLIEIKCIALNLKKEIFNILKSLEIEDLELLTPSGKEYVSKNELLSQFENLFEEVILKKQLEHTNLMDNSLVKERNLKEISNRFLKIGNLDKALKAAKMITNDYQKNMALTRISVCFLERGNPDKALEIRNEALELVKALTDDLQKVKALIRVFNTFSKREDTDTALEVLNEAIEIAKVMTNDHLKNMALTRISACFLERGNPDKALEVIKTITDAIDLNKGLMMICDYFLERGNVEKAQEVTKAMFGRLKNEASRKIRMKTRMDFEPCAVS